MDYVFNKVVNAEKLRLEMKSISQVYGITAVGNEVIIHATGELYGDIYDAVVARVNNHNSALMPSQIVQKKRSEAVAFGYLLISEFTDENILLGITQRGLTNHVRKSLMQVADALAKGSLYDVIDEVIFLSPSILDAAILTPARLLAFRNRIEVFLEIPKATIWNQPRTWV